MKSPVSIARYAASAMLLWATGASAQFDQTISVDGRYVPEYIGREKIGIDAEAFRAGEHADFL